jgi:hypothetical protein
MPEPFGRLLGDLQRGRERAPDEIRRRCLPWSRAPERVACLDVRDQHGLVVDLLVEDLRHEVRAPTLDLVRLPLALGHHRRTRGLGEDDLDVGACLLQHLARAGDRAAGADAAHEVVEALADEIAQDLGARRVPVVFGVRGILELLRQEVAVLLREILSLLDHAGAALGGGRQDHLRAEALHQLAPFDAEAVRHHRDERVALGRAHHRERDAGVAGRRLDHGRAGLQGAAPLGVFDHRDRERSFTELIGLKASHFTYIVTCDGASG